MTASASADGEGDTGVTVDQRKLRLGAWSVVGPLVLISVALLWLSIVTLARVSSRPIDSYTFAHLPVGSFYGTASGRLSVLCPSPLQWVKGYRVSACGVVLRRQSVLALVYLACGLVVADLALTSRHRNNLVERSVALRGWARAAGLRLRRTRLVTRVMLVVLLFVVIAWSASFADQVAHLREDCVRLAENPFYPGGVSSTERFFPPEANCVYSDGSYGGVRKVTVWVTGFSGTRSRVSSSGVFGL